MTTLYSATPEMYRSAFGPVHRAQQEGMKAIERLARFQGELARDFVEHNFSSVDALVRSRTPMEYLLKQGDLNIRFMKNASVHGQEFLKDTSEAVKESTSSIAHATEDFVEATKHATEDFVAHATEDFVEATKEAGTEVKQAAEKAAREAEEITERAATRDEAEMDEDEEQPTGSSRSSTRSGTRRVAKGHGE